LVARAQGKTPEAAAALLARAAVAREAPASAGPSAPAAGAPASKAAATPSAATHRPSPKARAPQPSPLVAAAWALLLLATLAVRTGAAGRAWVGAQAGLAQIAPGVVDAVHRFLVTMATPSAEGARKAAEAERLRAMAAAA
jgi:Meckel syndrome type 1 protein